MSGYGVFWCFLWQLVAFGPRIIPTIPVKPPPYVRYTYLKVHFDHCQVVPTQVG
ncbi:hypothetical protein PF008_g13486 [Phytophthora fragariae]|uniref:Uncharacterized protein n=1 Tax=Phytophthora fragariae TaxID=53985 RepID=A0A6G0RJX3_9STRA|nr:hypothetical protein PF008_g13486 [Phytophthora fragariae]